MAAITIVTLTSSVNDYSKERQFKALNDTKEIPNVKVLRDGKKYKVIKATEVMVGDIVHIEAGDILQCDGVVLEMKDQLKVDESDATGESDAISKKALNETGNKRSNEGQSKDASDENGDDEESDAFLLSGSKILEGSGNYLVLAVGTSSFQGRIFMSLRSSQPDQTRMQKQLAELAEKIAKLASIAGGILFVALFVRGLVQLKTDPDRTAPQKVQGFLQSFVIAITLIVVAVPEGKAGQACGMHVVVLIVRYIGPFPRLASGRHPSSSIRDQPDDIAQPARPRLRGLRDHVQRQRRGHGQDRHPHRQRDARS